MPVRSCVRRGAAIDLVLGRVRENRSQIVVTRARGREVIFWQSARTAKQARPGVSTPTRRASGLVVEILVDSHERYPWKLSAQQATTRRQALPAGDYAVEHDGRLVAGLGVGQWSRDLREGPHPGVGAGGVRRSEMRAARPFRCVESSEWLSRTGAQDGRSILRSEPARRRLRRSLPLRRRARGFGR